MAEALTQEELEEIFRAFSDGVPEAQLIRQLAQSQKRRRHRDTIRTCLAVVRFLEDHRLTGKIDDKTWDTLRPCLYRDYVGESSRVTRHYVQSLLRCYEAWKRKAEQARAVPTPAWREAHFRRLAELAGAIRAFLYNPHLEAEPYLGPRPHLEVNGQDWSLEPDMWLAVVTPDFDDPALWGELFPAFKEHTQASPFWQHLEELKRAVEEVEDLHAEAAARLGEQDLAFRAAWEKFEVEREWRTLPSRTLHSPDVPANLKPLRGPGFTARALDGFERLGFKVRAGHRRLVELLQKLNEDMMPDRIERVIEEGTCSLCR